MEIPIDFTDWQEFARRDDCLDKMVPSHLRSALSTAHKRGRGDGVKELIGDLKLAGLDLTEDQLNVARKLLGDDQT